MQRLRVLPGFKASVVAFVVTVIVGGGTAAAVANWQQSATATIAITAGSAPTPPPLSGNVVAAPVLAVRPGAINANKITCASVKNQASLHEKDSDFIFMWPAAANSTAYTVTLSFAGTGYSYISSQSVTAASATFTLVRNLPAAYGLYILRIQPTNGGNTGDAVYRSYAYAQNDSTNCYYASPGPSPLGTASPTAQPAVRGATTSTIAVNWPAAAGTTSYVVTVKSKTSSYGTEFTTSSRSTTLTFPQAARNAYGNPVNPGDVSAPYYGDYTFRIQPMNGSIAGDPTYKVVRYYFWSDSMGD
ncbi:hypothetical protein ACQCSX_18725 [Pseudarthrobacter sp. P1]|uniref:hypothetical protein n=1 Tax=Pseudarthrobacter sp. P1 TaxID=3418418 RepID=UPI003CE85DA6